ncbi:hypothetical protein B5M09_009286 [Aphanomyces astaci]|uniref:AB hydrolase-1 domain-containing protein n=1 Tax=Aphanomyces astaci TaxID=112090 RepID=A0A425CVC3_APHAT|nr:hypothetical protein B5M09_009286 [Aphanomyces astaci]
MSSSTPLQFNWYACPFQTAEDGAHDDVNATPAECADVAMPLCYPGVCTSTKTINVFVKRLLAVNPPPDKQPRAMWMVQGGPGFGSPSLEPGLLDAYEAFNGTLSVYTIDHRGTGRSSILNCTAAMDIATVIQAPTLFNGTDVFVYGVSFGTYTVARVMHLQPSNVKGYVLDSIQSEEFGTTKAAPYYSNWDRDVGDAGLDMPAF